MDDGLENFSTGSADQPGSVIRTDFAGSRL